MPALASGLRPLSTGQPCMFLEGAKSLLGDMPAADETHHRVGAITCIAGRRYRPAQRPLRIVEEGPVPGVSVSAVAGRHGVARDLTFRWHRLMDEAGAMAVGPNEPAVRASEIRKREDKVRTPERMFGRKTMKNGILREVPDRMRAKDSRGICRRRPGAVPPSRDHAAHDRVGRWRGRVAEVLGRTPARAACRGLGFVGYPGSWALMWTDRR